jgi:hypothetical protein
MSANMSSMSVDIYGTVSTMVQGTNDPAPAEENATISLMTTDIQYTVQYLQYMLSILGRGKCSISWMLRIYSVQYLQHMVSILRLRPGKGSISWMSADAAPDPALVRQNDAAPSLDPTPFP